MYVLQCVLCSSSPSESGTFHHPRIKKRKRKTVPPHRLKTVCWAAERSFAISLQQREINPAQRERHSHTWEDGRAQRRPAGESLQLRDCDRAEAVRFTHTRTLNLDLVYNTWIFVCLFVCFDQINSVLLSFYCQDNSLQWSHLVYWDINQ